MTPNLTHTISRRKFLNSTAMTAAGALMLKPEGARASASGAPVRLGLLGCGGRGTTVATGFVNNTQTRVVAIADLFPDKLDTARKHLDEIQAKLGYPAIDLSQIFRGPHACEQIAASKEVDFILITTPPFFHPSHLETVVAAGKHVYCEKPVAIDVPGAKKVIRIGEKAQGKLSLEVGFQLRKAPPYVELVKRIHAGALGEIGCGMGSYCCGHLDRPDWPGASPEEARLRNWPWDRTLSGDIIVEQNIHIIDIFNWTLQRHPVKAVGSGSRKLRTDSGNCWDNFNLVFTYPDDVQVSFNSTQFGNPAFDAGAIFYGHKGSSRAHYDHRVSIAGAEPWDAGLGPAIGAQQFSASGAFKGALDQADPEKQKAFIASITGGEFHNQAAQGAESALSTMLGRMAAYTGRVVTWDELMNSDEGYEPNIDLSKFS